MVLFYAVSFLRNFNIALIYNIFIKIGFAGPRYDTDGHVVAHSILGSYEDFQREAIKRGDLMVSLLSHRMFV